MQGVFPKRKNYKSRPVRCWCCLIGGFGHAFARIIRRIDVGDRKRSVAVKNNCPTVSPAVVAHARRHRTKTTRIEHRVIRSPYLPFTAFSGSSSSWRPVVLCASLPSSYRLAFFWVSLTRPMFVSL